MAELKFQFNEDKPTIIMEVEDNKAVNFELKKSDAEIGDGLHMKQDGSIFTFTQGKKTFKLYIE